MKDYPQPQAVFYYFTELAAIPHGSGNLDGIRKWALNTAEKLHLDAHADSAGNVIIRKAASPGYEDHPGVMLQGHLDMVCAKLPDCKKNMETEGLDLIWGDEYLSAEGTTLGGDDGIAVAYAFAVLADDAIPHPPLTVILTADEETGMDGASGLAPAELTGQYLINIDSEAEGVFTVGCAGGVRVYLDIPVQKESRTGTRITVSVSGLIGGHSGADIDKKRINANVLMRYLLCSLHMRLPQNGFCIADWQGGERDNVIPAECTAVLTAADADVSLITGIMTQEFAVYKTAYPDETGARLDIRTESGITADALTAESTANLLKQLSRLPNGVQEMQPELQMPETSLNLGVMSLRGGKMHVTALIRSGKNAKKTALADTLCTYAEEAGGTAAVSGDYPAWEYRSGTQLETAAAEVYTQMYGKQPVIETIHAGLECGILAAKSPQLECISIGPDLLDIHTPRERLSIPSAQRTFQFLLKLLRAL